MFSFGAIIFAACLSVHATAGRPQELLIYRKSNSQTCSLATLKETQEYRGRWTYGYTGVKKLQGDEERLRYLLESREDAWSNLESACGPQDSWEFPILTNSSPRPLYGTTAHGGNHPTQQDVLSVADPARGLFPLEFELEPLVKSGHSSNRVDLIFFADGCT